MIPSDKGDAVVPAPRGRGRPRVVTGPCEEGMRVSTYLTESQFERLRKAAARRGRDGSISGYLRDIVVISLR